MIFLEASPGLLLSLAVQLLELRLFFRDLHRILSPAEEHLDFIVFYSQGSRLWMVGAVRGGGRLIVRDGSI